jgi:nucleoside-diphosphate-sugar epimerase
MYGGSKAMMDTAVAVYRARYGIDVISVRPSHVYGPGRRTDCLIRAMIGDALAGRPTVLGWGRGYARPYCHVDDSVEGIMAALLRGPARQAHYNIAGDQMVAIERIAALVRENLPGATITLGQGAPPGATRRNLPSIAAATRDFGYRPKVDIGAGIAAYAAWAKARGGV